LQRPVFISSINKKRTPSVSKDPAKPVTKEMIYIKDLLSDTQQAVKVPHGLQIKQMTVWGTDTLFVLAKGGALLYASNLSGLGKKVQLKLHPSFKDVKVKKLAFGLSHMLILTKDGVVFALGDNTFGQLGVASTPGNLKIVQSPLRCEVSDQISVLQTFIDQGIKVRDVACGEYFSVFISEEPREAVLGAGDCFAGKSGMDSSNGPLLYEIDTTEITSIETERLQI
jgi:alpha-tubulin suppressor-like RCC1 family protein